MLLLVLCPAMAVYLPCASSSSARPARHQEIQALGRHFSLGALYDIRRELLLSKSLWSQGNIERNKSVTPQPHQDFRISAANNFDQKSEFMDIEGSLKMSFLGGLVEVSGSAKYLESRKSRGHTASVSAVWSTTRRVESLTQEFFANIEYENGLDDDEATHVVTRIVYGADAYFKFEKSLAENEDRKVVEGELEGKVGGVFKIKGKVDIKEEDRNFISDIKVVFNGDFDGITPPTTYAEAATVVQDLVKADDVVPMRVTLTPLHKLDDRVVRQLREVNHDTIRRAAKLRSYLEAVDEALSDELLSNAVKFFPNLKNNIRFLQRKFQKQGDLFREQLQILLPGIRNNSVPEQQLTSVLDRISNGVYHESFFKTWLEARRGYANTLAKELAVQGRRGAKILHSDNELVDFQFSNKQSYYLLEGSLKSANEEPYMTAMEEDDKTRLETGQRDRSAWVHTYRRKVLRLMRRFENMNRVKTYTKEQTEKLSKAFNQELLSRGAGASATRQAFAAKRQKIAGAKFDQTSAVRLGAGEEYQGIGQPKMAIRIEMPGDENNLKISTYYAGEPIDLKPVENVKFVDGETFLQFDLQEINLEEDYEGYEDYYYDGPHGEDPIAGYEISLRNSTRRTPSYHLNVLSKESLTPGQKYFINVRVILKGGVRGPWNTKPYAYTRPIPVVPTPGGWSEWSTMGECSASCGGAGVQRWRRRCDRPAPFNGGEPCLATSGSRQLEEDKVTVCGLQPCPENCEVGPWSAWGRCSVTCGGGTRSRSRSVTRPARAGGAACPSLAVEGPCHTEPCPVDCRVGPWSACSQTCGGGTRTRSVTFENRHGGTECPRLNEYCNTASCSLVLVTKKPSRWLKSNPCARRRKKRSPVPC